MDSRYNIFVSYSRKNSEQVLAIVKQLQEKGFTVWIDRDGIESGDAFKTVIVRAIKMSDVFLFFSSIEANDSPWTVKEVNTAVHLKKTIIPIRMDDSDYNDSVLFDLVGLDYVDLTNEEKAGAALNKLINTLFSKTTPIEVSNIESKDTTKKTLSNVEGFEVGYDVTVYVIHKLRGKTTPQDDAIIKQKLTLIGINPDLLLANLNMGTMISLLSDCAVKLGRLFGKQIENCVCLGSLFVLSVIAKRSNISDEYGHSYDKGIISACSQLGIADGVVNRLISGSDDEMESMLEELKQLLSGTPNEDIIIISIEESYKKGKDLYYQSKYQEALKYLTLAAEQGHADAQYFSGLICYLAYCGIKDFKKAAFWFEKAAVQDHVYAEEHLGRLYEEGKGVEKNYEKAMYWYVAASKHDNPDAYFAIGGLYEKGKGVEQNDELAFQYYLKAASMGSSGYASTKQAMRKVAAMYEYGVGTHQNRKSAIGWLKKFLMLDDNMFDHEKREIEEKIAELEKLD